MKADETRKFSISDGLLLIGGIAISLGCVRATFQDSALMSLPDFFSPRSGMTIRDYLETLAELGLILGLPVLAAWTPCCLMTQLIRPRPPWRRLRRQPGFVANLIASSVTSLTVAAVGISDLLSLWEGSTWFINRYARAYVLDGFLAGTAVLWSWVAMWLCGSFRSTPTWKDRLGRINGAGWIVMGVICAVFIYMKLD